MRPHTFEACQGSTPTFSYQAMESQAEDQTAFLRQIQEKFNNPYHLHTSQVHNTKQPTPTYPTHTKTNLEGDLGA